MFGAVPLGSGLCRWTPSNAYERSLGAFKGERLRKAKRQLATLSTSGWLTRLI